MPTKRQANSGPKASLYFTTPLPGGLMSITGTVDGVDTTVTVEGAPRDPEHPENELSVEECLAILRGETVRNGDVKEADPSAPPSPNNEPALPQEDPFENPSAAGAAVAKDKEDPKPV